MMPISDPCERFFYPHHTPMKILIFFNPVALRTAKTLKSISIQSAIGLRELILPLKSYLSRLVAEKKLASQRHL